VKHASFFNKIIILAKKVLEVREIHRVQCNRAFYACNIGTFVISKRDFST